MNWRDLKIVQIFRKTLGRWLRKKGKITEQTQARQLVVFASGRGAKLMQDLEFKKLMKLDSVDQFEHGRILNELVAAMLTLLNVYLQSEIPRIAGDRREFWRTVQEELIPSYKAWLSEIGIEKNQIQDWEKLLLKRFDEYDDYERDSLEFTKQNPMQVGSTAQQEAYIPIMTISAYTMMYLRHGKRQETDRPIQTLIQRHLVDLQNDLMSEVSW